MQFNFDKKISISTLDISGVERMAGREQEAHGKATRRAKVSITSDVS